MQDNHGNQIRLIVGTVECKDWDEVTIDSQIDVPADAWSLSIYNYLNHLPENVKAGQLAEIYFNDELVLTGIVDNLSESVDRNGYKLNISGRDLMGQLIDCSVPIKNTRQITLSALIQEHVLSKSLGTVIHSFRVQDGAWLKNKVSVEPSESIYDTLAKAAQVTGQWIWIDEHGVINIGDPFKNAEQNLKYLILMRSGQNNNVLDVNYTEDVSGVFSDIQLISQDEKGRSIAASSFSETPYQHARLKIITLHDIDTQAEANTAVNKIKHDNDLEAYNLIVKVKDWTINGELWKTGWQINFQTDVIKRCNANWVVMGRTLKLSRSGAKTTELKLKRKGDWTQPLIYKETKK